MSRERKEQISFRVNPEALDLATKDAERRGCTVEKWAEEVFEHFAVQGYRMFTFNDLQTTASVR